MSGDPLSSLSPLVWGHVVLMVLAVLIFFPIEVGLTRTKSSNKFYVQAATIVCVVGGITCALVHYGFLPQPWRPTWHAILGIIFTLCLFAQAACTALYRRNNSSIGSREMLMLGKYVMLCTLLPFQVLSGIAALFQLCTPERSGLHQCVGHFGISTGFIAIAIFYYALARKFSGTKANAMRRRYRLFAIESGTQAAGATCIILYSLYSERPYSTANSRYHLIAGVVVLVSSAATLALIRVQLKRRKVLSRFVTHGTSTLCATIACCVIFAIHNEIRPYRSYLNSTFAATLIFVGISRVALFFRVASLLLFILATLFIAMQRGFQVLFDEFYTMNLFATFLLLAAISVAQYVVMHFWFKKFWRQGVYFNDDANEHIDVISEFDELSTQVNELVA